MASSVYARTKLCGVASCCLSSQRSGHSKGVVQQGYSRVELQ